VKASSLLTWIGGSPAILAGILLIAHVFLFYPGFPNLIKVVKAKKKFNFYKFLLDLL